MDESLPGPSTGFEVEVKYRVEDPAELARRLVELGAGAGAEVEQLDAYLAHPSRDFAATGEAFRVRRSGSWAGLTYKGPKHAGPTKTREEIEVGLEGGSAAVEATRTLLSRLGFVDVAEVVKRRRPYRLAHEGRELTVAIDEVRGLGTFAEVEGIADLAGDLAAVQAAVLGLSAVLGLDRVEPRSYLRMHLEQASGADDPPGSS